MNETVQKHREYFKSGVTLDLDWRIHQLKILKKTIKNMKKIWYGRYVMTLGNLNLKPMLARLTWF